MICLTDALVAMTDSQLSVTEADEESIDVCIVSGVSGNIEVDLVVIVEISDGTASKVQ